MIRETRTMAFGVKLFALGKAEERKKAEWLPRLVGNPFPSLQFVGTEKIEDGRGTKDAQ